MEKKESIKHIINLILTIVDGVRICSCSILVWTDVVQSAICAWQRWRWAICQSRMRYFWIMIEVIVSIAPTITVWSNWRWRICVLLWGIAIWKILMGKNKKISQSNYRKHIPFTQTHWYFIHFIVAGVSIITGSCAIFDLRFSSKASRSSSLTAFILE